MRVVPAVGLTVLATFLLAACATGEAGVVAPDRVNAESFLASPLPEMLRDDEELLLLIHGSGEGPSAWPARVQAALAGRGSRGLRRIVRIDWASAAADRIVAPRRGEQIGAELARYLVRSFSPPGAITVVSHSAGAFLAHGFACELRRQKGDPVRGRAAGRGRDWTEPVLTQLFLDPFLARSPLRWRYGIRRFGTCADRAFAWVNTGDPVPFTSGFPRHAEGRDLTGREDLRTLAAGLTDSEAPGHWIPVAAFVRVTDDLEPGSTLGEVIGASTDQAMEEFPWAMFAKGPACTKAGCPSIVCGRFGRRESRSSAVAAPVAGRPARRRRAPWQIEQALHAVRLFWFWVDGSDPPRRRLPITMDQIDRAVSNARWRRFGDGANRNRCDQRGVVGAHFLARCCAGSTERAPAWIDRRSPSEQNS